MSLVVDGSIKISMEIMGSEFDLKNSFHSLQISTMVGFSVPICRLLLVDPNGLLAGTNVAFVDGAQFIIKVATGKDFKNEVLYDFRVFQPQAIPTAVSSAFVLDGYLNHPEYLTMTAKAPFNGTSLACIEDIAKRCGIVSVLSNSALADKQIWRPNSQRFAKWVQQIANHGYADDFSCMEVAMDEFGRLRYMDLTKLQPAQDAPQIVIGQNPQGSNIKAVDYSSYSTAGFDNFSQGYGNDAYGSAPTKEQPQTLSKVAVKTAGGQTDLAINMEVKNRVEKSPRQTFLPVDSGNVSDVFFKGLYQNQRIGSTYSQGIRVLLDRRTPLQVLDPVSILVSNVTAAGGQGSNTKDFYKSGQHIIRGKTTLITPTKVYEALDCIRNVVNAPAGQGS